MVPNATRKYEGSVVVAQADGLLAAFVTGAEFGIKGILKGPDANGGFTIEGEVTSASGIPKRLVDEAVGSKLKPYPLEFDGTKFIGTLDGDGATVDYEAIPTPDFAAINVSNVLVKPKGLIAVGIKEVVLAGDMSLEEEQTQPGTGDDTGFLVVEDGDFYMVQQDGTKRRTKYFIFQDDEHVAYNDLTPWRDSQYRAAAYAQWQQMGFNAGFIYLGNQWHAGPGQLEGNVDKSKLDDEAFDLVETILTEAGALGIHVHVWIHGDNSRNNAPAKGSGVDANETALLQAIGTRYGQLPWCSFGLGFDVQEWRTSGEVDKSLEILQNMSGIVGARPLIMARGFNSENADLWSISGKDLRDREDMQKLKSASRSGVIAYQERHTLNRTSSLTEDNLLKMAALALAEGGVGFWTGVRKVDGGYPNFQQDAAWEELNATR
jgi:hypothetical protein